MKNLYLRSGAALLCALGLAGCGGSSGNLLLGGTIVGLTRDGLKLQNNGGAALVVAANATSFSFPDLIGSDTAYDVTVLSSPPSASCVPTYANKGKSAAFNVTNIIITCTTFTHNLSGTISGLGAANTGLVLVNGSDRQEIAAGATSFTMTKVDAAGKPVSGQVPDGSPYGVTVLTPPAGKSCSVNNGAGTMAAQDIATVQVVCI